MPEQNHGIAAGANFENVALPHLDAAYNLARWLARNSHDAEDIVQEAYLRAFKFFGGYQGGDSRAWILKIVRNTSYSFLEKNRPAELAVEFNEEIHATDAGQSDSEAKLLQAADRQALRNALEALPVQFREVVILRELEGMSYKEIADVMDIPIGTVMSGLARGRTQLKRRLLEMRDEEIRRGLQS